MKFTMTAAILALAGIASAMSIPLSSRQNCPEATRFGVVRVTPETVSAGDSITINVDLTCGVNTFGIIPKFLDYTLEVPAGSNNGFEQPIVLARRTIPAGALSDSFTTTIPHGFFVAGAPYNLFVTDTYNILGTDNSPVLVQGGVLHPITINV